MTVATVATRQLQSIPQNPPETAWHPDSPVAPSRQWPATGTAHMRQRPGEVDDRGQDKLTEATSVLAVAITLSHSCSQPRKRPSRYLLSTRRHRNHTSRARKVCRVLGRGVYVGWAGSTGRTWESESATSISEITARRPLWQSERAIKHG